MMVNNNLVGGFNHLEKYEFINGKDDIPYVKWKIKNVCNHQPELYTHVHHTRHGGVEKQYRSTPWAPYPTSPCIALVSPSVYKTSKNVSP